MIRIIRENKILVGAKSHKLMLSREQMEANMKTMSTYEVSSLCPTPEPEHLVKRNRRRGNGYLTYRHRGARLFSKKKKSKYTFFE